MIRSGRSESAAKAKPPCAVRPGAPAGRSRSGAAKPATRRRTQRKLRRGRAPSRPARARGRAAGYGGRTATGSGHWADRRADSDTLRPDPRPAETTRMRLRRGSDAAPPDAGLAARAPRSSARELECTNVAEIACHYSRQVLAHVAFALLSPVFRCLLRLLRPPPSSPSGNDRIRRKPLRVSPPGLACQVVPRTRLGPFTLCGWGPSFRQYSGTRKKPVASVRRSHPSCADRAVPVRTRTRGRHTARVGASACAAAQQPARAGFAHTFQVQDSESDEPAASGPAGPSARPT